MNYNDSLQRHSEPLLSVASEVYLTSNYCELSALGKQNLNRVFIFVRTSHYPPGGLGFLRLGYQFASRGEDVLERRCSGVVVFPVLRNPVDLFGDGGDGGYGISSVVGQSMCSSLSIQATEAYDCLSRYRLMLLRREFLHEFLLTSIYANNAHLQLFKRNPCRRRARLLVVYPACRWVIYIILAVAKANSRYSIFSALRAYALSKPRILSFVILVFFSVPAVTDAVRPLNHL